MRFARSERKRWLKSMASTHSEPVPATCDIDGLTPSVTTLPATPQELADLLASARSAGKAVAPLGGGTKLSLGNVPDRLDLAVSTAKLSGIINYEPTDMTLSVWAGTTFADVNSLLAKHGQTLPLDVASPERATIGGLIATGIAGPRRSGSATFRDLLIGISAAHPSGTVTKAGGMVVKNVTGFDLMRLYLGSLGTLGVIVSANFKVLPLSRSDITIRASFSSLSDAIEVAQAIRESRVQPVALEVFLASPGWEVAIRIEGREATAQLLSEEIGKLFGDEREVIDGAASKQWWLDFSEREAPTTNGSDAVFRCATRPRAGHELFQNLNSGFLDHDVELNHASWSPAIGATTFRASFPNCADMRAQFLLARQQALEFADNVTVLAAPA